MWDYQLYCSDFLWTKQISEIAEHWSYGTTFHGEIGFPYKSDVPLSLCQLTAQRQAKPQHGPSRPLPLPLPRIKRRVDTAHARALLPSFTVFSHQSRFVHSHLSISASLPSQLRTPKRRESETLTNREVLPSMQNNCYNV